MKKLILAIMLATAFFVSGIRAEETTLNGWVWTGAGWIYYETTDGGDPIPPPPPPPIKS